MKEVSSRIKELETRLNAIEEDLQGLLLVIPNIPHESVVFGREGADNPEVRRWGKMPEFSFPPTALGDRGNFKYSGFRPGCQDYWSQVHPVQERRGQDGKGADEFHAGPAHGGARLP